MTQRNRFYTIEALKEHPILMMSYSNVHFHFFFFNLAVRVDELFPRARLQALSSARGLGHGKAFTSFENSRRISVLSETCNITVLSCVFIAGPLQWSQL